MVVAKKEATHDTDLEGHISDLLPYRVRMLQWDIIDGIRSKTQKAPSKVVAESLSDLKEHGIGSGKTIMDVGCGWGRNTAFFSREGYRVIGVDFSSRALKIVKKRIEDEKLGNVSIIRASAAEIPLKNGEVDAALTHFVLVHLKDEDRKLAVDEIYRTLKPGGIAVIMERMPEKEIMELFKDFRVISLEEKRRIAGAAFPFWKLIAEKMAD